MRNRPHLLGVYGGSFDPIHLGHLLPVEEARVATGLDEILYVPAFAPPHKPQGPSASAFHRFGMCAVALEAYPHLLLSDFEASRGGTTYSVETLRHVRANHPDSEVFLVVGSDSMAGLHTWREWREIVSDYRIVVVYREGTDYPDLREKLPAELAHRLAPLGARPRDEVADHETVFWAGNAPVTISSTWIRSALPSVQSLSESLPPAVERYARRHRLYVAP
ncbi:MAG: nicotinate (nicotinamide) nucleotide adenylyltransferase [Thermoanaerobaculia bacterium]